MWVYEDKGFELNDCGGYRAKMCFCVGPEKCGDTLCPQVRAYQKRQKCLKKKIKKMIDEIKF